MNDSLNKVLAFCEERVKARDIYVWGGNGQKAASITEAWIRKKESDNQKGAHADQAVKTWQSRVAAGLRAFRAYDCSGFVSAASVYTRCAAIWIHRVMALCYSA